MVCYVLGVVLGVVKSAIPLTESPRVVAQHAKIVVGEDLDASLQKPSGPLVTGKAPSKNHIPHSQGLSLRAQASRIKIQISIF